MMDVFDYVLILLSFIVMYMSSVFLSRVDDDILKKCKEKSHVVIKGKIVICYIYGDEK